MKKLFIIAGQTGLGKTQKSFQLAQQLKTDIIIGDSIQIYKNWPICGNHPSNEFQNQIKYHLLGNIDALKIRINTVQYRHMVMDSIKEILANKDCVIIEGGSNFYINYLLNTGEEQFTQKQAEQAEYLLKTMYQNKDLDLVLKELCPSYDGSIAKTDIYRLQKAIRFAIMSEGKQFKVEAFSSNQMKLNQIYDVRGIFMYTNKSRILQIIDKRCDLMVQQGMLDEILNYVQGNPMEKDNTPIGFKEGLNFLIQLHEEIHKFSSGSRQERQNYYLKILKRFVQEFQINTRKFATYQRKYFRNKMNGFIWVETDEKLVLQDLIEMKREDYDKIQNSEQNNQKRLTYENIDINRNLQSIPLEFNQQQVLNYIYICLIPRLQKIPLSILKQAISYE